MYGFKRVSIPRFCCYRLVCLFRAVCAHFYLSYPSQLGPEKLKAMYGRTGAPLSPAYALPQLRAFYKKEENEILGKKIHKWVSIATICIYRWCGKPHCALPMGCSEAAWTGMLNFREGTWDEEAGELFENCPGIVQCSYGDEMEEDVEIIDLLPQLFRHDAPLPFLVGGIPQRNDCGGKNSYWEKWPEFRSRYVSTVLA